MKDYIKVHATELAISHENLTLFPLCRAVNNTINCVLEYPEIKKIVLFYGEISKSTKVAKCNDWFIDQEKENGIVSATELDFRLGVRNCSYS